jgi:hypothetical protein
MTWQENLLTRPQQLQQLIERVETIAVLGIKTEAQPLAAAYYVPQYLQSAGFEIVPVPVYYPDAQEILGRPVYRRLIDIPTPVDLVLVFRRPADIPQHDIDVIAKLPEAVWFQLGIREDASAEKYARAGIKVVQNRCLMVDHRRLATLALN